MRIDVGLLILASSMALPPRAAAHGAMLDSAWRNATVTPDAPRPASVPLENGRVSVAVANDDRFLYFTLTTHDRSLVDSMYRNGMTLWIDPKGGHRETLGVRYPIGIEGDPVSELRGHAGPRTPASSVPPDRWLEIVGTGDDDPRRVALGDIPGLDVQMQDRGDTFVYEAKLPLVTSADRSFVTGAALGGTIGVGWKTDRSKSEDTPPSGRGPRGGMGGGSHGGMGGGSHGGTGGGGGGSAPREDREDPVSERGPKDPKPLRLWVKVRLAAAEPPWDDSHAGD